MSNNIFIDLSEELYNKGWTVNWEFNTNPLLKYNDCVSYLDCRAIDSNVATDVEDGAWNYRLDNLETGGFFDFDQDTRSPIIDGLFLIDSSGSTLNTSLKSFNVDLPNLTDGTGMFAACTDLTSFTGALPKLTNGNAMFTMCTGLTEWNTPLPKLEIGGVFREWSDGSSSGSISMGMFFMCTGLTEWNTPLPNLTDGISMFGNTGLTSWNIPLPKLTDGTSMFYGCAGLTEWNTPLPNLTDGDNMFEGCTGLTSWTIPLPKLTDSFYMFYGCTSLTSFSSALPELTSGLRMFADCKLNTASVQNIASTINDLSDDTDDESWGWGEIEIGIGNTTPNAEEEAAFNTIASKGWTVYVNGKSSSNIWTPTASANLTNEEEQSTPSPFYAKPVQVTEEHAEYVDANNNYYNIVGAQFIYGDDLSTYGMFTSYEHAESEIMTALNLTKIEK